MPGSWARGSAVLQMFTSALLPLWAPHFSPLNFRCLLMPVADSFLAVFFSLLFLSAFHSVSQ